MRTIVEGAWAGWTIRQVCGSGAVWTAWSGTYSLACIDTGLGNGAIYLHSASCNSGDTLSDDSLTCTVGGASSSGPVTWLRNCWPMV